jgi:cysteinyl-tRNA synthetase
MKIYNTLNKQVEEIKPIAEPTVSVYTCGPTVYDYPHVGNWFTFIRYDTLIRALKLAGYSPHWVLNITDVGHLVSDADDGEDKLEKGAKREGKTAQEVAEYYTDYFIDGLKKLNITTPNELPRATQHIPEQIALIETLQKKGFTYVISDGVYFDTTKFPTYSDFAQLDLDEQQEGARVSINPEKRKPTDFALWKFSPENKVRDMEWNSPWGKGFPGWHIECSAMAIKYLGETIDIHAGGIDHVPVHHTNEIAQSEASTDKEFAHYWMHSNHITIDGGKISKSDGNGIRMEDIEEKGFSAETLRLLVLQSNYRSQSQFSWDIVRDADSSLRHLKADFSWIYSLQKSEVKKSAEVEEYLSSYQNKITQALLNDMDTPTAISLLHESGAGLVGKPLTSQDVSTIESFANFVNTALGISLLKKIKLTAEQQSMLREREKARESQDWEQSDEIRDLLAKSSIGLRDTPNGTIWFPL